VPGATGDGSLSDSELTVSVIVVTLSRPDFVRTCLEHIAAQTVQPLETVVVDASPDDVTYHVVIDEFPQVGYIRNPAGAGTTGLSRNLGLAEVGGDVVAFIDDDAFAWPDWIEELRRPYVDAKVGGVGGRALNDVPDGESFVVDDVDDIGRLHPDGTLSGNFAADPGRVIEVDHFLGANMSFRREALKAVGGIRDGYPGTCLREETDLAFRVSSAGWRLVFAPRACVRHVAAPYPKGRRFDIRYTYYTSHNHVVLLARTRGFRSPELRRYLGVAAKESMSHLRRAGSGVIAMRHGDLAPAGRTVVGALSRAGAGGAGAAIGLAAGYRQLRSDRAA
jgi:GT2 family glycosyltransferase